MCHHESERYVRWFGSTVWPTAFQLHSSGVRISFLVLFVCPLNGRPFTYKKVRPSERTNKKGRFRVPSKKWKSA
jgi:hypothetical protein